MVTEKAVYAGSFDLLTIGHMWMINQGAELFGELVVAVGDNPAKRAKAMFTVEERVEMLEQATAGLENVTITVYTTQFLFAYAEEVGARLLLRGIRDHDDYDYEREMNLFHHHQAPKLVSIHLIPPPNVIEVSSSYVKGLIGYDGWEEIVRPYVPESVFPWIVDHHRKTRLSSTPA
jgi:pantetheine-phosphate adenylyltransferase